MTIHRCIPEGHPFFDECLQVYLLYLGTLAVGLHVEAQKDATRLATIVSQLLSAFEAREDDKAKDIRVKVAGTWDLPDYPEMMRWQSLGSSEDCLLHVSQPLVDFARKGERKPATLEFTIIPANYSASNAEMEFPDASDEFEVVKGAVPTSLFETVLSYLVGGAFERFRDHFSTTFGKSADWPPELQFFRHLRNGCFHGNAFRIDQRNGMNQIDPSVPPIWHSYVMPSDAAMNGKKVIGQNAYFHPPHLLLLLDDMGTFK
ncbi:MAG TPA: hypothetical protein VMV10_20965 [Pirellulales bacterium]|nr:hypothetical protein [Pirellulales bacterium]